MDKAGSVLCIFIVIFRCHQGSTCEPFFDLTLPSAL